MPLPYVRAHASPVFTIGALAIAARRANAIGAVRLTLAPERLEIELIHVAGFAEGFAPSAIADTVSLTVPYLAVRGLVRRGDMLFLTLDPAFATPYNRFALVRFSNEPADVLARAYRARAEARWASYLAPAPLGALASWLTPDRVASGWLGRASLMALVALASFAMLRHIAALRTWGGPVSDRYRDLLETELAHKLGLVPPAPGIAPALEPPRSLALDPEATRARGPRVALAVAAAVALSLSGMMFLDRYATPREPPPAVPALERGLAAVIARARAHTRIEPSASSPARVPDGARCACLRADSPLFAGGVPHVSLLMFHGESGAAEVVTPTQARDERAHYDFDVAAVNNAALAARDVRVTLTFARRDAKGRRVGAVDRGLFWAGALAPGRAVKWHVEAPGAEMRVDASVTGTLEERRLDVAAPDAFFALTRARFRAVRVHAAAMLAYLRDPRAIEALAALGEPGTKEERLTLARIERAAAPVFACDIKAAAGSIEACVFNGSSLPQQGLELREVRAEAEPSAPPPRSFRIEGTLPVHEGVRLRFPLEGAPVPDSTEWAAVASPRAP